MKEEIISERTNYYPKINNTIESIMKSYILLVEEFLNLSPSIVQKIPDKKYSKYLISNGLLTINHVFNLLLLYTKNIQLVVTHSQKAFYYYAEFISQIGETNAFLQLTSHDASLFVYKKTIYEINKDYIVNIKDFEKENKYKLNIIKLYTQIFYNFSYIYLDDLLKNANSSENIISLITLFKKIINKNNNEINFNNNYEILNIINIISNNVKSEKLNIINLTKIIEVITKKYLKVNNKHEIEIIKNNLYNSNFENNKCFNVNSINNELKILNIY